MSEFYSIGGPPGGIVKDCINQSSLSIERARIRESYGTHVLAYRTKGARAPLMPYFISHAPGNAALTAAHFSA